MIKPTRKKDKRGFAGVMFFIIALIMIVIIGFIGAIAVGLFDYAGDVITPVFADIGVVGDTNMSQVASYTITPANTFVQALPWLMGFGYVIMLIFSIVFVVSYESNPHPAFMGAYIFFVILIVFGSIIISNMYQDIYIGDDELGTRLKEQATLSYMILYSPAILSLIAILTGIFLFSRPQDTGGGI